MVDNSYNIHLQPFRDVAPDGTMVVWIAGDKFRYPPLSKELVEAAKEVLRKHIPDCDKVKIRNYVAKHGPNWVKSKHLGWGLEIRNVLRRNNLGDNKLPTGTWDDYYPLMVELTVGAEGGLASFINESLSKEFYKIEAPDL